MDSSVLLFSRRLHEAAARQSSFAADGKDKVAKFSECCISGVLMLLINGGFVQVRVVKPFGGLRLVTR